MLFAAAACAARASQEVKPLPTARPVMNTDEGDTIVIIVHQVRANQREEYERWMSEVWWPAVQKAAAKFPQAQAVFPHRSRFVPTEPADDGTYTYFFIYPPTDPGLRTKRTGIGAMLEASGMPDTQVDRELKTFQSLVYHATANRVVQRDYASPGSTGP
jgi:hypothetical protein